MAVFYAQDEGSLRLEAVQLPGEQGRVVVTVYNLQGEASTLTRKVAGETTDLRDWDGTGRTSSGFVTDYETPLGVPVLYEVTTPTRSAWGSVTVLAQQHVDAVYEWVETRRNLAPNPRATSQIGFGYYRNSSTEAGTTEYGRTGSGIVGGPDVYARRTITKAKTADSTGWMSAYDPSARAPVTGKAGETWTFSVYLRSSVAIPARAILYFYDKNNTTVSSHYAAPSNLTAGAWARFTMTATPTAAFDSIGWWVYQDSGQVLPAGATYDAAGLQIEKATAPTAYFDGSKASNGSKKYSWEGTVGASASIEEVSQLVSPEIAARRFDYGIIQDPYNPGTWLKVHADRLEVVGLGDGSLGARTHRAEITKTEILGSPAPVAQVGTRQLASGITLQLYTDTWEDNDRMMSLVRDAAIWTVRAHPDWALPPLSYLSTPDVNENPLGADEIPPSPFTVWTTTGDLLAPPTGGFLIGAVTFAAVGAQRAGMSFADLAAQVGDKSFLEVGRDIETGGQYATN